MRKKMVKLWITIKTIKDILFTIYDSVLERIDMNSAKKSKLYDIKCTKASYGIGDGRWTLCPDGLDSKSIIYSVGIGYDISFDLALINKFSCTVFAFDPTQRSQNWLQQMKLPFLFKYHNIGLAHYDGNAVFKLPPNHTVSFSMRNDITGHEAHTSTVMTMQSLMSKLGHHRIDILKIDIEGAEYDVIPHIASLSPQIDQLLIEFHSRMMPENGNFMTEESIKILRKAGFKLFHISQRGLEYSFIGPSFNTTPT